MLTGGTFVRALYFIMGLVIVYQFAIQKQWTGMLFGIYFASMGLFKFGCAAGNCYNLPSKNNPINNAQNNITEDIQFEEVK